MKELNTTIESVVREAVTAQTQAAVIEAFGGADKLVSNLVNAALNQKVERKDGYRTEYETWLAKMAREVLQEGIREACKEIMVEQQVALRAEIKKRIVADRESLVDSLMVAFKKNAAQTGYFSLAVNFQERS